MRHPPSVAPALSRQSARRPTGRAHRRGATAVEFAVVAPLFFMMILAMIELARGVMVVHQLADVARVGCRAAAVEGQSTAGVQTRTSNYLNAIGIRNATTTVKVNGNAVDATTAQSQDEITVVVSAPVSGFTWLPGGRYLTGSSVAGEVTLRRE
jgi:Flp pilus assembly protein TadG